MAALGLIVAGGAGAQFFTGRDLLELCSAVEAGDASEGVRARAQACVGYFTGFWEGVNAVQGRHRAGNLCVPPGVAASQLVHTYIRWARAHPEYLNGEAGDLALRALEAAYACDRPRRPA